MEENFKCINCGELVSTLAVGTQHRNHCPVCLWSKHLDVIPGDRRSLCNGPMKPIGLCFKSEGGRHGEVCLAHLCASCQEVSKNRIAGDDDVDQILKIFKTSFNLDSGLVDALKTKGIILLASSEADEIITQLFGRPNLAKYKKQFDL